MEQPNSGPKVQQQPLSPENYLATEKPPANIEETKREVVEWLGRWGESGKKVVLVTSGGTTVPLEKNTVRFVDNFSAGTRGSRSAEYFLEHGYAVIFLHRQSGLQPYSRHFSHTTNCFLDYLTVDKETGIIKVDPTKDAHMKEVLNKYQEIKQAGTLLSIDFLTVTDYLHLLALISQLLAPLKSRTMIYLAAAVSDFYLPDEKMNEHKIQSDGGDLNISLAQVPKFVTPLTSKWAPDAYTVTFKLETDLGILATKARKALDKYHHQLVIANLLHTRAKEIWFFSPRQEDAIHVKAPDHTDPSFMIESLFLPKLIEFHEEFIKSS